MTNLSGINLNNGSAVGAKREGIDSPSHSLALMPKYEAYKNSGVEWLGDIPSSWELKPGFVAFSESKSNNKGMKENTVLSLSYGNIVVKPEEKLVGLVPESFETYQLVEPDDIIVRCTDLQNDKVSLRTGLAKDKGIITNAYLNLQVKSGFDARFLHYYLHALDTTKVLYKFGSGLRQNLSFIDFKRLPIFEIPEDTQKLIANYLDQKTAQIDDAIAIKEQQISLLKERKQISIQQAVTQGLDPNVPIKDSGVEWIGEIPEHWDISIAKYILKKLNRPRKQNGDTVICSNHGCSKLLGEVNQGLVSLTQHDYQGVDEGDLLVHGMDAWHGAIAISEHAGDCTSVVHVCDSIFNKAYISYFLKMLAIMNVYKVISNGVRGNTSDFRSWSKFGQVQIILPPMDEQAAIVELLNKQTQDTELAIKMLQNQISALKEYKYTLINSAVTGKIKITPEMVEQ